MKSTTETIATAQPLQLLEKASHYFTLSKPRIVFLVAVTGFSAMVLEGTLLSTPLRFAAVLLGIILAAGSAGALNQYFDRDIDALMARTRNKRPIPAGKIAPRNALVFAVLAGLVALYLLQTAGNELAASLGLLTIFWYIVVYTLWLKRRNPQNIVIGGAAGAATPLIGWAAGAGELTLVPWLMFLVIFLWTPTHFWALALYTKEEYARAHIPMLPVVSGEKKTIRHITCYTLLLLPTATALTILSDTGLLALTTTTLMGTCLLGKVIRILRKPDSAHAKDLFLYSNVYLAVIFAFILVPW